MYCTQCGNPLKTGNNFCANCGAAVEISSQEIPQQEVPVKKRKCRVLPLILGLCIVGLLIFGAITAWPILFPGKETVYLLAEEIVYSEDGSVYSRCILDYDEQGRLVDAKRVYTNNDSPRQFQIEYDEYGNRSREVYQFAANGSEMMVASDTRYDFSYDDDGRVKECEIYDRTSENKTLWEFTYDDDGNLILVELGNKSKQYSGPLWQYYKYDKSGNLTAEYFCTLMQYPYDEWVSHVYQQAYKYDENGNLTKTVFSSAQAFEELSWKDLKDLDFEKGPNQYDFDYDRDGRLIAVNDKNYEYDKNGNLDMEGFVFDEQGNLICDQSADGSRTEYIYEAVTLSRKDAQIARRQKTCLSSAIFNYTGLLSLDPIKPCQYLLYPRNDMFYNYMIPHPIW